MKRERLREALQSGVVGLGIGVVAAAAATSIWPTPWSRPGALIAVAAASFFAAAGGAYGALR